MITWNMLRYSGLYFGKGLRYHKFFYFGVPFHFDDDSAHFKGRYSRGSGSSMGLMNATRQVIPSNALPTIFALALTQPCVTAPCHGIKISTRSAPLWPTNTIQHANRIGP